MPGYQISVVSAEHLNHIVYTGTRSDKRIVLYHHNGHFDYCNSLPAFFNRSKWCHTCDKGFNDRDGHRCLVTCSQCLRQNCVKILGTTIYCGDCNRDFFSQDCFDFHKLGPADRGPLAKRRSICSQVSVCPLCSKLVSLANRSSDNTHQCGEVQCQHCHVYGPPDHQCYMQPLQWSDEETQKHRSAKFIFFDFETYVGENKQLVPNLAVRDELLKQRVRFCKQNSFFPLGRSVLHWRRVHFQRRIW